VYLDDLTDNKIIQNRRFQLTGLRLAHIHHKLKAILGKPEDNLKIIRKLFFLLTGYPVQCSR